VGFTLIELLVVIAIIAILASLGANPCRTILGKPTVATVPPNFTARLAATGTRQKSRERACRAPTKAQNRRPMNPTQKKSSLNRAASKKAVACQ